TSRSVNPASPRASLNPPPAAASKCMKISVVRVSCKPVNSVATFDVACSACDRKLFGPLYWASNDGCHCAMMLSCPETHQRVVFECGNIVSAGSAPLASFETGASVFCAMHGIAKHRAIASHKVVKCRVRAKSLLGLVCGFDLN